MPTREDEQAWEDDEIFYGLTGRNAQSANWRETEFDRDW